MSGIKTGVDSKGRRFKTVDGKRVSTGVANAQSHARKLKGSGDLASAHDAIRRYLKRAVRSGSKTEVKKAIQEQLNRKFGLWFKVQSQTSAGKSARLYAARMMLQLMRGTQSLQKDDQELLKKHTTENSFASANFARNLGFSVEDRSGGAGAPAAEVTPPVSEDVKILAVVHKYKLNAQQLDDILRKNVSSDKT